MAFIIDRQTINDLNIFGKVRGNSVYGVFNSTRTRGGAQLLEEMFHYPLSDAERINHRSTVIRYFMDKNVRFDFQNEWFDALEGYLANRDERSRLMPEDNTLQRRMKRCVGGDMEFEQVLKGVLAGINLINTVRGFLAQAEGENNPYAQECKELAQLVAAPQLAWTPEENGKTKLSYARTSKYDNLLRYEGYELILKILRYLYQIDAYISIAEVARERGFVFAEALPLGGNILEIEGMFHPLIENAIPNSIQADAEHNVVFLTGANMAGKSTYMRQTALIVLMAQIGSFVPAKSANIGLVDRIFTRVGASDDLASGQSTFMVEMNEVANILRNATANSLLILDEIGRGTSTFDGLSIAWAVVEYISNPKLLGAKTLFATHYHELTELEGKLNSVNNYCIAVKEKGDDIVFLRKIVKGGADKSYGIQVAKLAGIPELVINRAKDIVNQLSANDITETVKNISVEGQASGKKKKPHLDEVDLTQMSLFDTVKDDDIIQELRDVDISHMTPMDALNKLYELQNKVKNRW